MKAVIHIGAPKTGSSTIQEFLRLNSKALAAQGFRYESFFADRTSQFEFPMAALARIGVMLPNRDEQLRYGAVDLESQRAQGFAVVQRLAQEAGDWAEATAIFSSEHIQPWLSSAEAVRAFDQMFGAIFDEVRYVLYIRNQEDLLLSLYSQDVKNGGASRLDGFFGRMLKLMDHEAAIMRWTEVVGRQRFDLRLLDPSFLVTGDLIADFCATCGISLNGLARPSPVNESLTAAAAEVIRQMNARVPHLLPEGGFNPLSLGLVEKVERADGKGAWLALNTDQRARLNDQVRPANERIRMLFFPDRAALFSPPRDAEPATPVKVLQDALDISAKLIIQQRMGEWPALSDGERQRARHREPSENTSTIAGPARPPQNVTDGAQRKINS